MPKRISNKKKQLVEKLFAQGLTVVEIARKANVSYSTAWGLTKAKEKGFDSLTEYRQHLAKEKGFDSFNEYQQHLAKERQKRPENKGLSYLIVARLKELGKNQNWLANEIGVTRQAVSMYVSGSNFPSIKVYERLSPILGISLDTLDDLVD